MIRAGQKLYEERIRKGLTPDEVSSATKIKKFFLQAIEKGDYGSLPSSAYAQGFVKNYASFLGLSQKEMLALFRREFDDNMYFKVLPEGLVKKSDFPIKRLQIIEKGIYVLVIIIIIALYILFQYRYAVINPPLEVTFPKDMQTVTSEEIVVSGKTDPNATVYVNDMLVSLDQNGKFKKSIDVFSGKTTIKVKAVNRFRRETVKNIHIDVVVKS